MSDDDSSTDDGAAPPPEGSGPATEPPDAELRDEVGLEELDPELLARLEFASALAREGWISDDLAVAELVATDGPAYDLMELSMAQIEGLLGELDAAGLTIVIDRAGHLIGHHNDERRIDAVFDRVFGADETARTHEQLAAEADIERRLAPSAPAMSPHSPVTADRERNRTTMGSVLLGLSVLVVIVVVIVLI